MPRWEGRGGFGITGYFNIQDMSTRPARYKKVTPIKKIKEQNYVQATFKHVYSRLGVLINTQKETGTELTFEMCSQMLE